jgi:hypothetical protein
MNTRLSPHTVCLITVLTTIFLGLYAQATPVGDVFVIDMESRNWSNGTDTTAPSQLFGNSAAPFINKLVTVGNSNAVHVSYATAYHNVLATSTGNNPSIHPSEPNHLWLEGGSSYGAIDNSDPYGTDDQVEHIGLYVTANPTVNGGSLSALLQSAGISWKSYIEDVDLETTTGGNGNLGGSLTSTVLSQSQWTVPLASFSGQSSSYTNPYNGSDQYNFSCAHVGPLFFTATNGSTTDTANTGTSNAEVSKYAPLQQLAVDLASHSVARYNLIVPDQFNDMSSPLRAGFTYLGTHYTGSAAQVAQGDNFLASIIPQIEASQAFINNGVIIIRTDDTQGTNQNDFTHTLMEIVISPLAKGNATNVADDLTHSSDLATFQEIFGLVANTPTGYLNDAANPSNGSGTKDLADFFQAGTIPSSLPQPVANGEPTMPQWMLIIMAVLLVFFAFRRTARPTR